MNMVKFVKPRKTVEVHLPDGRVLSGLRGAPVKSFLSPLNMEGPPVVGAQVNGALRELTYPIEMDARVNPVTMGEEDGMRIYRQRSHLSP